jgi:hypothetical protein
MEKEKERDKKKAKELANYIISVEPKGEREFVILTVSPPRPPFHLLMQI